MKSIQQLITDHIDIWTAAEAEKKSGRGRSSNNTNSVYGINKLRELILGLAISGKLLPQNSEETPTPELIKKHGIKKKKLHETLLNEFSIPTSWEWHYISDLCDLKTGATPSTSKSDYYGGQIRWLVSGDINNNEIYDCDGRITEAGLNNSNCKVLPKNSVLIALNGQGKTRATVAILRVEAACNQSLVAIIPKYEFLLSPEFIYLNLKYRYYEIRDITGQNQRRGLNMGLIGDLSISVPPLPEQHRIVGKVNELMALCDQLETQHNNAAEAHKKLVGHLLNTLTQSQNDEDFSENWQRIVSHFDILFTTESSINALKQTLLQLAVMGKLVRQNINDEPASELLKHIKDEKEKLIDECKIKRNKSADPISREEIPFEIPDGWSWARMIDCTKQITDGEHLTPERTVDNSKIPLVTAKNVRDGSMDYENTDYVDFDVATKCWNRCKPEHNDILIVSVGATIGRLTIINDYRDMVIVRSVTLVKPLIINTPYLALALRSPVMQKFIWRGVKQNAQPCLYLSVSNNLPIPVPPLAEQQRIVSKVNELTALCDKLKQNVTTASQLKRKLADGLTEKTAS